MNNPTDAANSVHFELPLADQFIKATGSVLVADSDSMPSVLVDQLLIDEIHNIPDRFGFKIGDVADLLGIKQYILRYWEQEFDLLKPKKASNNQRMYTRKDVENAFLIRKLLYRDRFSIEGARQALKDVKFALKQEKQNSVLSGAAQKKINDKNTNLHVQISNLVSEIQQLKKIFS